MVIGHDHIHAQFSGIENFINGGNTVIHRYNQLNVLFLKTFYRLTVHTITFGTSVRYVINDISGNGFQVGIQQRR